MAQLLTAQKQSISKVFGNDYVFSIPGYQRPYSWATEQAQELLEDLLSAMQDAPADLSDAMPYFLGCVVLIKSDAKPDAEVVDGQQRLTTLTILLSAIRHAAQDPGIQSSVTKYIYEEQDLATGAPDRFRLKLRDRDADFFRKYIQQKNGLAALFQSSAKLSEVEQRIRCNAQWFVDCLSKQSPDTLKRLYQYLMQCCTLVVVSTPDLDSAYRIFGVMNSRGLDLSATDVLKSDIIGKLPKHLQDIYTAKWEDEEERMGRERFIALFSHIRTIYLKAKSQATLLKDFRENVHALRDAIQHQPQQLMDDVILPMAEDFEQISTSQFSSTQHVDAINNHLQWLNRLEFQDWVPPTLAFLAQHRNEPVQVLAFLADLERLAYSMLLRRDNVNQRIRRFAEITKSIEGSNPDFWTEQRLADSNTNALSHNKQVDKIQALYEAGDVAGLEAFKAGSNTYGQIQNRLAEKVLAALKHGIPLTADPLQLTDEEKTDTQAVLNGELYGKLPTRALTVVLKRIDQLLSNQNATYSGDVSIEHVLPQNPAAGSEWLAWIPEGTVRAHWVHRLGNLVLLSRNKNSEAQNYDFDKKKKKYFTGRSGVINFALTTQVTIHSTWNEATLQARHDDLLAKFVTHWRLA